MEEEGEEKDRIQSGEERRHRGGVAGEEGAGCCGEGGGDKLIKVPLTHKRGQRRRVSIQQTVEANTASP